MQLGENEGGSTGQLDGNVITMVSVAVCLREATGDCNTGILVVFANLESRDWRRSNSGILSEVFFER